VGRFLAKRVLSGAVTLFVFVTILFFVTHMLMAADFVSIQLFGQTAEVQDPLREALGLNDPVWQRYLSFLGGLATGSFGRSFTGPPVSAILKAVLPWTALVFTLGVGIGFAVGHKLGRVISWRRPSRMSNSLTVGSIGFHTLFPPLLAFMLMIVATRVLSTGRFLDLRLLDSDAPFTSTLWTMVATILASGLLAGLLLRRLRRRRLPSRVAPLVVLIGLPIASWNLFGIWSDAIDALGLLSLPIIAVALLSFGEVAMTVDGVMAGVAEEDYILTARAKGLRERDIRDHHAARASLLPVLSKLMVSVPYFLTGLVIIEESFAAGSYLGVSVDVPGLSRIIFSALQQRNVPVTIGSLFAVGLIMLAARLALDVAHAYLDPRIRYATRGEAG
jgi:peptide/nickel transport system permease protein